MTDNSDEVTKVSEFSELEGLLENNTGVILYFYSDDCAPCISLRPKVKTMSAEKFPKMKLIFVNSKSNPDISAAFNVFANPVILIFFEGKEFRRFSKYIGISELSEAIERYYKLVF